MRVSIAVSAIALLLAATTACNESSRSLAEGDSDGPTAGAPPPVATPCLQGDPQCIPPDEVSEEGDLSDDDVESVIRAAEGDTTLSELLGNAAYEVVASRRSWEFRDGVTFASVNFSLADALPIDADLPRLDTGSRGGEADPTTIELPPPGYAVKTVHYQLDALQIMVLVHLETGEVMMIFPIPFSLAGLDTGAP